tara:strand:- start:809 stop:1027 length:219 start_codon:yes stop_codon:yes gene_type:complete
MSKDYWVTIPVDCHVVVSVHADSEEEAKEKALETDIEIDIKGAELEHFELMESVHTGNVCHITHWDIEVEEQ